MNARAKGQRGEREFCQFLESQGFTGASRNDQQGVGGFDNPDIFCRDLDHLHFEVKRTERLSLYEAMKQAQADCCRRLPVVAHRRNRGEWLVVLTAEDFLKLIQKGAGYGLAGRIEEAAEDVRQVKSRV